MDEIEQTRLHNSMENKFRGCVLKTMSPLEAQARDLFTSYAFRRFQEELLRASQYYVIQTHDTKYLVQHHAQQNDRKREVYWDGEMTLCSCKEFEFSGIICRHILSVFIYRDCFKIPKFYFPSHWCHEVTDDEISLGKDASRQGTISNIDNLQSEEQFVACPPKSVTKGRSKQKRQKGGIELAKKTRACSCCRSTEHYKNKCTEWLKAHPEEDIAKRKKIALEACSNPVFTAKY